MVEALPTGDQRFTLQNEEPIRVSPTTNELASLDMQRITLTFIGNLVNMIRASAGKAKNKFRRQDKKEEEADVVTRLLNQFAVSNQEILQPVFRTVLIDEAHLLRNICSYWGIGAALMGLHGERIVPLTGTPYNNGPKDMAAIMTFVDPSKPAAKLWWWENATKSRTRDAIVKSVRKWRERYMLRRGKDVLVHQLPPKTVASIHVSPYPAELFVYDIFEEQMLDLLREFRKLECSSEKMLGQRILFKSMMAKLACQVRLKSLFCKSVPSKSSIDVVQFTLLQNCCCPLSEWLLSTRCCLAAER